MSQKRFSPLQSPVIPNNTYSLLVNGLISRDADGKLRIFSSACVATEPM